MKDQKKAKKPPKPNHCQWLVIGSTELAGEVVWMITAICILPDCKRAQALDPVKSVGGVSKANVACVSPVDIGAHSLETGKGSTEPLKRNVIGWKQSKFSIREISRLLVHASV